jgi:hypothetical protein
MLSVRTPPLMQESGFTETRPKDLFHEALVDSSPATVEKSVYT